MTMTALALAAMLVVAPAPELQNPWFGEDKITHFVTSFAASSFAASGARAVGLTHEQSLAVGAGVGLSAAIGKEVADTRRGSGFSARDMAWNLLGLGASFLIMDRTR